MSSIINSPGVDASLENDVLFQNVNNAKIITLNRPKKLNSLNYSMISKIYPRLIEYSKTDQTQLIITNSNGRAFCSGGDVVKCFENNMNNQNNKSIEFFQKEYSMNYLLSNFNKPIVSIMNGITMGGGVGLAIHTPFRIATEDTIFAMPEMDIGFSPDVGTSFALNKILPYSLGWYLALTGEKLSSFDVYFSGIATHYIPKDRLNLLTMRLTNVKLSQNLNHSLDNYKIINNILEEFTEILPNNYKFKYSIDDLLIINDIFRINTTMENIFNELSNHKDSKFCQETLSILQKKSPLSLKIALEVLQRGYSSNIYQSLTNELNIATNMMQNSNSSSSDSNSSDFNKGVESKLILKSSNVPNWKYKSLNEVPVSEVLKFFKSTKLSIDKNFNKNFNQYPFNFGLPKFNEIDSFINEKNLNNNLDNDDVILEQVINHFATNEKYSNKVGLNEYLEFFLKQKKLEKTNLNVKL